MIYYTLQNSSLGISVTGDRLTLSLYQSYYNMLMSHVIADEGMEG